MTRKTSSKTATMSKKIKKDCDIKHENIKQSSLKEKQNPAHKKVERPQRQMRTRAYSLVKSQKPKKTNLKCSYCQLKFKNDQLRQKHISKKHEELWVEPIILKRRECQKRYYLRQKELKNV